MSKASEDKSIVPFEVNLDFSLKVLFGRGGILFVVVSFFVVF
jgi:hypothetical protein